MLEKLALIAKIFKDPLTEAVKEDDATPLQHGNYFGGMVNGRKFMYSDAMIAALSIEKLERVIKNQTGL